LPPVAAVTFAMFPSTQSRLRKAPSSGIGTTARYVGTESDLIATYQIDPRILGYVSYNHFFSGDFIKQTGPSRGSDYVYGALQFTF